MKYYLFRQNNSGGYYSNVPTEIYIQAPSSEEANEIATKHGIYFDGIENGFDCECCGDRWNRVDETYAIDKIDISFMLSEYLVVYYKKEKFDKELNDLINQEK